MALKPIKKAVTLTEQAYTSIKEAILLNQLKPGTALAEEQLSSLLSISRTPIRTALQQLVYEKLAVADATGHIFVSTITEKDVDDVTVMRTHLEPLCIELAEFPLSPEKLARLQEIQRQQETLLVEHPEDNYSYAALDTEFHIAIAHLCDNILLRETVENLGPVMVRINILSGTLPPHKEMAMKEHAEIIRYLADGQKEFAVLAMREHVKKVASRILVSMN